MKREKEWLEGGVQPHRDCHVHSHLFITYLIGKEIMPKRLKSINKRSDSSDTFTTCENDVSPDYTLRTLILVFLSVPLDRDLIIFGSCQKKWLILQKQLVLQYIKHKIDFDEMSNLIFF